MPSQNSSAPPKQIHPLQLINAFTVWLLSNLICIIRPMLGPAACRYEVRCTAYALEQLQISPLPQALLRIAKRVLSCNPVASWFGW